MVRPDRATSNGHISLKASKVVRSGIGICGGPGTGLSKEPTQRCEPTALVYEPSPLCPGPDSIALDLSEPTDNGSGRAGRCHALPAIERASVRSRDVPAELRCEVGEAH